MKKLMDYLRQLETTVLHWVKDIPHLPTQTRRWLGTNAWRVMLVTVIVGAIWALFTFFQLMTNIAVLDSVNRGFLVPPAFVTPWTITTGFICLGFSVLSLLIAAFAVKPLQTKIKEGWVLLFVSWLILAITIVLYAVLSLNPLSFIIRLLFGAIFVAILGYALFEMHGQFAHNPKKAPVENSVTSEEK